MAAALLAAADGGLEPDDPRFDPELLKALHAIDEPTPPGQFPADQRRSLASLARALEETGHRVEAGLAYRQLVERTGPSAERVFAQLGLARLAHGQGRPGEAGKLASRAMDDSEMVGPGTAAEATLSAGLLLTELGHPRGQEGLLRAQDLFRQIGSQAGQALASLALGGPSSVRGGGNSPSCSCPATAPGWSRPRDG